MLSNSSLSNSTANSGCHHLPGFNILNCYRYVTQILLNLPLAVYVLILGFQRWKPRRSFDGTSHSDVFTFHLALMLLLGDLGVALHIWAPSAAVKRLADNLHDLHAVAEVQIHCLICVDRYLAIVRPVLYLKLKQHLGVAIRNVALAVVWCLSLLYLGLSHFYYPNYPYEACIALFLFVFCVVFFCSVSVLRALIRPAPGNKDKKKDQAKLRAFRMIMAIMVTVLVWVAGIVTSAFAEIRVGGYGTAFTCWSYEVIGCLSVPCNLVLLVLYVHRVRKQRK